MKGSITMAKASKNNRSIILEDVEVLYNETSDSLSIISKDPDLPKGEFFMQVRPGTASDAALRKAFAAKTGNKKIISDSNDTFPELSPLTDSDLLKYEKTTFPIGVTINGEPVNLKMNPTSNRSTASLIAGQPGSGKTVIASQLIRKATVSGIPLLSWSPKEAYPITFSEGRSFTGKTIDDFNEQLVKLFSIDRDISQPAVVIIEELMFYLTGDYGYYNPANNDWLAKWNELEKLLRFARSFNISFVFIEQSPSLELMSKLEPFLSVKIVGRLATVSSAIILGTNDAVKLRTGEFIVQSNNVKKTIKVFPPLVDMNPLVV